MPVLCSVWGCENRWRGYSENGENRKGINFHVFPKPTTVRIEWITRCGRLPTWNPSNYSRICSLHFSDQDYERDLRNELLGLPVRKRLKENAIPTICLPTYTHQIKNDLETMTENDEPPKSILLSPVNNPEVIQTSSYNDLFNKFTKLRENYDNLCESSTIEKKKLNQQLRYYKKKSSKCSECSGSTGNNDNNAAVKNILKDILTENQISLLLNKKKRVNWTNEEISTAFTLRYYSKKSYTFIRNNLHYPLPGLSSLRRWASKMYMGQGILRNVLTFLKVAGEEKNDFERTTVISFDEIKVKSVFEYDSSVDEIVGPHNYMQVIMARGLFSNWKQPIYIGFDKKMTKEILFNVITELHNISYDVVACVSDCGGGNIGLWKELKINIDNTSFKHPQTNNNVHMFGDAPHLLKLLRNWLLDTGFDIGDTTINKKPLENLIYEKDQELNVCYKVNTKHIEVEKTQRQNVRMAAELLSNTVGEALLRYKPGGDKKLAEDVGNFICDANKWFDIFNSYVKNGKTPFRCAYGVNLEQQKQHLNYFLIKVKSMRAHGKSSLQTFQKGMIISIQSLKLLFNDMEKKYKIGYICTHKLNQDCLENFFFQIRSRGPNEHPSPLIALKRIRMIILGKNPGILEAHVNTKERVIEEYISSSVMLKADIQVSEEESDGNGSTSQDTSIHSSNPSQNSDNYETSPEMSNDALEYIAGYLAKKFKKVLPNLGQHTYQIQHEHDYNLPSWVQQLSYGGLIKPNDFFYNAVKKWNKYFEHFHGSNHKKGKRVVRKIASKIYRHYSDYPQEIVSSFCKLRTIIRINYLNIKKDELSKQKKRKNTDQSDDSSRKETKKLKKIVN